MMEKRKKRKETRKKRERKEREKERKERKEREKREKREREKRERREGEEKENAGRPSRGPGRSGFEKKLALQRIEIIDSEHWDWDLLALRDQGARGRAAAV